MPLSDTDILACMEKGEILIRPFRREQLKNCQYDVRLGKHFYREQRVKGGIFNIWSQKHIEQAWYPGVTISTDQLQSKFEHSDLKDLPNCDVILLEPGETILGHTEEFIGGVKGGIVGQMFCRSSLGRSCITVCKCAGWGDCGYYNRWTMEITNISSKNTIPLIVGQPIAQIVFSRCDSPPSVLYTDDGHYQRKNYIKDGSIDVESLIAAWKPEDMLSRLTSVD